MIGGLATVLDTDPLANPSPYCFGAVPRPAAKSIWRYTRKQWSAFGQGTSVIEKTLGDKGRVQGFFSL